MNWCLTTRPTGIDMAFIGGILIGFAIAALIGWAVFLWVIRIMVGG